MRSVIYGALSVERVSIMTKS